MRLCDFRTIPHLPKPERCLGGGGGRGGGGTESPLSTAIRLKKERHGILCNNQETDSQFKEISCLTSNFRKAVLKWECEFPAVIQESRGGLQRGCMATANCVVLSQGVT